VTLPGRTVGVLGCGNLGTTLVRGLLGAGADPRSIQVTTWPPAAGEAVAQELGVVAAASNVELTRFADVIVLTVKPGQVAGVCEEIAPVLGGTPLVTCAAGVPVARCLEALGDGARVGRAMPNVGAAVRAGSAAVWLPETVEGEQRTACLGVFEAAGSVVELPDETLFDAATALVGSGPAFVCLFVEALADGAVLAGMPRALAEGLAVSIVGGTATLLERSGEHPACWKDRVMSPGGTTAAGVHALERGAVRAAVMDALLAATERARELSFAPGSGSPSADPGGEG